jgi:hypothetical protein
MGWGADSAAGWDHGPHTAGRPGVGLPAAAAAGAICAGVCGVAQADAEQQQWMSIPAVGCSIAARSHVVMSTVCVVPCGQ